MNNKIVNQMKLKVLFLLALISIPTLVNAQRGVRIGYIDTEYILENVPEYSEATSQLESKVQNWKNEIDTKLSGVKEKRNELNNEKALLTKELVEEREEDLFFEEKEILDYQQKRFGPNGDLMIQKKQLMQPIQDQIFQAVQDIAKAKKYDFVFDKSADVVMLYSADRFDMSEQVLRTIKRASKRNQAKSKFEKKNAKEEDVVVEVNEEKDARQEALDKKKKEREALAKERREKILAEREAKKKELADKRKKALEARKNGGSTPPSGNDDEGTSEGADGDEKLTPEQILEARKKAKLADREARKKQLEERKKKILEDRKKAKEKNEAAPKDENQDDN